MKETDFTDKQYLSEIDGYLRSTLSPGRYEHSVSTANTCRKLAGMFSYDRDKAYFTGLVHDIAREYSDEKQLETAVLAGIRPEGIYLEKPMLLHGRAGAYILEKKFGIEDREILDAISVHTTGDEGMSILGKILFIADYIEPKRRHITPAFLRKLERQPLDAMVAIVLNGTIEHLRKEGRYIAPEALKLLRELEHEE